MKPVRLSGVMRLARRSVELSWSDWWYIGVASTELLIARLRLATMDAGALARAHASRDEPQEDGRQPETSPHISVERVSWAFGAAAAYVPWRSDCLVQAMAGYRWLLRHGIQAEFIIGVSKAENKKFEAHAWLRHGGAVITGGAVDRFTPLLERKRE